MQRVKNVGYDEDDLYDDDEDTYEEEGEQSYTAEDKDNFATLTPVVRAELEEAGVQASDKDIEDALWHYFWDIGKSVAYLKNSRTPRPQQPSAKKEDKAKAKSKFDEAAQRSAEKAGESHVSFIGGWRTVPELGRAQSCKRRGGSPSTYSDKLFADCYLTARTIRPPMSAAEWFQDVPWTQIPPEMQGNIVPNEPLRPMPKLLGGSSKLAKLAEERRKKAAAAANGALSPATDGVLSSLDRLSKSKDTKENDVPVPKAEPKKYPIRRKREPTPPPREPTPPPPEPEEEKPNLRASPTGFGRTLAASQFHGHDASSMTLKDILGSEVAADPFKGPSPDDTVLRAQQHSKGLAK